MTYSCRVSQFTKIEKIKENIELFSNVIKTLVNRHIQRNILKMDVLAYLYLFIERKSSYSVTLYMRYLLEVNEVNLSCAKCVGSHMIW